MALHIPHSILHLARLLYVRLENLDPTTYNIIVSDEYCCSTTLHFSKLSWCVNPLMRSKLLDDARSTKEMH